MKIKTKNAKNGVTFSVKLALHKDLILKTPKREGAREKIRVMEVKKLQMERHYEGSQSLFFESRAQSISLQICIGFFTIYSGTNI